ncbi:ABC transporter [Trypanosoma grayi]|uniref:ABC transporter n=1 Tax=Trypanosoma grayi TaxID=71804 RepID=UPI0004F44772|nr:ABC transporter [Trypanosoma grayi]KEG10259.1 ABC transporter [Trypanosoma grayi]
MASRWSIQYGAFMWKIGLQRMRAPGTTLAELLLPCFFTLLLSVGYWYSTTTSVPATNYATTPPTNLSTLLPAFFCQNVSSPHPFGHRLPVRPCPPVGDATACFPFVRGGALCTSNHTLLANVMFGVYYAKGSVVVPTLDAYLALSAFATYESQRINPTFFGRSGRASLSHYGRLLLVNADGNTAIAAEFAEFCANVSALCEEVVYTDRYFTSVDAAQSFARENDGTVWAIVELPSPSRAAAAVEKEGEVFTISMNYTATPWTFDSSLPFSKGLGDNTYMLYVTSGFLTLQNAVQQFYARRRINHDTAAAVSMRDANASGIFQYASLYGPSLVPMPAAPYSNNSFYSKWAYFMPLVAMLAALFPVAKLVSSIVEEKSMRIRESMHIMGLRWSCMALGWYTSALLTDVVASLLVAMMFRISFFHYVNYGVLFFLYFSFMQQNSALSLFLSTFFNNPRAAGAVAALTIFLCSIPFYSFPEGMSTARLISVSIIPCVAYSEAFNRLVTSASFDHSFSWADVREGEYSVAVAIGMMWASTGLMLCLWAYLDQVVPSSIGRRRHPLFFLAPLRRLFSFCCCCCSDDSGERKSKRTVGNTTDEDFASAPMDALPQRRSRPSDDDIINNKRFVAVFRNLWKVYYTGGVIGWIYHFITGIRRDGDRCVAVRGVSFELELGQVNVLLGPNGSGKSTVMGIATGMVKPTRGDVYICSHDAAHHLSRCQRHIGYCPQTDIVWGRLTVEQHLTFYARMKSGDAWDVQKQVNNIIAALQLEEKRHSSAGSLSGGQRRRLCVGIALVGQPEVLFLDEPTAGMDLRGRKAVYDALQSGRNTRTVMISTHLLDEADRVGDRILLMQDGVLRGAGSSLFLKSKTGAGYIVTCVVDSCLSEMEESVCISRLTEFVRTKAFPGHCPGTPREVQPIPPQCKLLGIERRGREISFRFPLSLLSSAGATIIRELEARRGELRLHSIGLSLTTLQDVLDSLTERKQESSQTSASCQPEAAAAVAEGTETGKSRKGSDNELCRGRDAEQGISIQIAGNEVQESLLGAAVDGEKASYDNSTFDNYGVDWDMMTEPYDQKAHYSHRAVSFATHFAALFMKRVHCAKRDVRLLVFQVLLPIVFLSVALLIDLVNPPSQPAVTLDASLYNSYNTPPFSEVTWTRSDTLPDVFGVDGQNLSAVFGPYYTPLRVACNGAKCSIPLSGAMISDVMNHSATRHIALSLTSEEGKVGVPVSVIMHNVSAPHAAPQALNALYNVVNNQLFGKGTTMTARNEPMRMGPHEEKMVGALRRVICGIFILLPFTFIPSNTVSFMVRENQSGSRHLQWLAGANVFAFWLSSMLFDFLCFLVTEALAMSIFVIFKRTEFVGDSQTVGATLALFSMFGLSSIPFSYVISFFFDSPFVAQNVVLIANFVLGFLWVMGEQIIGGIDGLENFMLYTTYILRAIPSVSFGEGMFTLSGVELGNLMMPDRPRPNLFDLLEFVDGKFKGGIGTGLIYMSCTFAVSLLVLVLLEVARVQRLTWVFARFSCRCCSGGRRCDSRGHAALGDDDDSNASVDESVVREVVEVCREEGGRPEDCIALQHVTKRYRGSNRPAISDLSLGVQKGEIMGLLGLNGAGKTTTVGVLTGEVVPTSGSAFINHYSVLRSASRSYVGYCPQKDALLDKLSPYEHLMLYAALRGASDACLQCEIPRLLAALGLAPVQHCPAYSLSGGNKRRLSLAIALVGGTTSVLLDEPTAGMDANARRQTCAVVKRLTKSKSVILTTHLLDETEALADRVAFIAKGRLRCVGTPQELKSRFTDDAVYTVRVVFAGESDLLQSKSNITQSLCGCFVSGEDADQQECVVESVVGRTVTLLVRHSLTRICSIAAAIREGQASDLPPVVQVSATQPTLEDILLRD